MRVTGWWTGHRGGKGKVAGSRAVRVAHLGLFMVAGLGHAAGMSEPVAPLVIILLSGVLGLLLLALVILVRIAGRVAHLERQLGAGQPRAEAAGASPTAAETAAGGAFETFLSEDPARRELPKGEQFAAYRRWRQARGLNWTNV